MRWNSPRAVPLPVEHNQLLRGAPTSVLWGGSRAANTLARSRLSLSKRRVAQPDSTASKPSWRRQQLHSVGAGGGGGAGFCICSKRALMPPLMEAQAWALARARAHVHPQQPLSELKLFKRNHPFWACSSARPELGRLSAQLESCKTGKLS